MKLLSLSECKYMISPTYEFVVDIFQEGQLWMKELQSCHGDVFAPWDVQCSQAFTVLHQEEQRSGGIRGWNIRNYFLLSGAADTGDVGVVWHSPVSDVITTGEVEMLQSLEIRYSLCHSTVTDPRAVAEGQAGEAAAVPGYWCQAGVGDLRQHGEWQTVEVRVTHHLRQGAKEKQRWHLTFWNTLRFYYKTHTHTHTHIGLPPVWCCCRWVCRRQTGPAPAACWELKVKLQPAVWTAAGRSASPAWAAPQKANEEAWRSPCCRRSGWTWDPCRSVEISIFMHSFSTFCKNYSFTGKLFPSSLPAKKKASFLTVSLSGSHLVVSTIPSSPQSVTSLHQPSRRTTSLCR